MKYEESLRQQGLPDRIAAAAAPLAAAGNPAARLIMRCLTCDGVDLRCSECWERVHSEAAPRHS